MNIYVLILGDLETNCYILEKSNRCIIIDPADNPQKIIDFVKNYTVEEIIVTHHHFDHIGALKALEKHFNIKHNLFIRKNFNYEIIKTPGHTDDSISIYFAKEKYLVSGDLIFYHSIGRYDFKNSSYKDLKYSLDKISKLPIETKIFPGHGNITTLKEEQKFFKYY